MLHDWVPSPSTYTNWSEPILAYMGEFKANQTEALSVAMAPSTKDGASVNVRTR